MKTCMALFLLALLFCCNTTDISARAPYPPSLLIKNIEWDFDSLIRLAPGSDLWPVTWGADDNIYTSWGDGGGFGGTNKTGRASLGFAKIEGPASTFKTTNVWGGFKSQESPTFKGKCAGLLSVEGKLYAWINMQNGHPSDLKLAWSPDFGAHWKLCEWEFSSPGSYFPSTFLNFGKDYAGSRDDYIYIYGGKWIWAQGDEDNIYLARVKKNKITVRAAYEFFSGLDNGGKPIWVLDIVGRKPVFTDLNGVGNTGLAHVVYNPGIKRYLMAVGHRSPKSNSVANEVKRLGIFDAPEPWGPWTTVAYYENWGGFGTGEALGYDFPTKWISSDGKAIWMVFSSTGELDSFNLIRGTMVLKTP